MNSTLKTKLLNRITELISMGLELAKDIRETSQYNISNFSSLRTGTESLILKLVGENSPHYKNLQQSMMSNQSEGHKLAEVNGVLRTLGTELEQGLIGDIENLAREEVFRDLLERARYYLETGDKDSATFLGGAVLEDNLRKIAQKHNIPVKDSDDISSLNTKLANAEVYPRSTQKQIQAWKAVRDPASHGKFGEYTTENVKYMLDGVQNFLAEHLG